jgi:hypothetical protein
LRLRRPLHYSARHAPLLFDLSCERLATRGDSARSRVRAGYASAADGDTFATDGGACIAPSTASSRTAGTTAACSAARSGLCPRVPVGFHLRRRTLHLELQSAVQSR